MAKYRPDGVKKKKRQTKANMKRMMEYQLQNQYEFCSVPSCKNRRNSRSLYCSLHKYQLWLYGHVNARGLQPWKYKDDIEMVESWLQVNPKSEHYSNIIAFLSDPEGNFHTIFKRIKPKNLDTICIRIIALMLLQYRQLESRPIIYGVQHLEVLVGGVILPFVRVKKKFSHKQKKTFGKYVYKNTAVDLLYITRDILKQKGEYI